MFSLFKKKDEKAILDKQYKAMLQKSFELSTVNRAESDKLRAEAELIADKIAKLQK